MAGGEPNIKNYVRYRYLYVSSASRTIYLEIRITLYFSRSRQFDHATDRRVRVRLSIPTVGTSPMETTAADTTIITAIEIDGLFGYLDYRIRFDDGTFDRGMNLLYGDNGCGKTTILRLLYSCLSTNSNEGLRGYIALIPFQRICIKTSFDAVVEVTRDRAEAGPYTYSLSQGSRRTSVPIKVGDDLRVNAGTTPELPALFEQVRSIGLELLFVTDDRQIRSTLPFLRMVSGERRMRREPDEVPEPLNRVVRGESSRNWLDLTFVALNLLDFFRRLAIEQGNFGQMNANAIYLDLVKRLSLPWPSHQAPSEKDFKQIMVELDSLEERAAPILALRAMSTVPFGELRTVLANAVDSRRSDLVRILQPFLESTRARIDALAPSAQLLTLLISELNGFFTRKEVSLNSCFHANDAQPAFDCTIIRREASFFAPLQRVA
jgi:hypothetical protein